MSDAIISLLYYTVKLSTPLLLCTVGGVFVQRTGTMNFSLEGAINTSCFTSIVFTVITGNPLWGLIGAVLSCLFLNLIFGTFVIRFNASPVIIGLAINMLMMAVPPYLLQAFFESRGLLMATEYINVQTNALDIPILRSIPIIGPIFNNQTFLTYFTYLIILVLTIVFYKTKFGVYVRVTGESKDAAEAVGIKTNNIKWIALAISGVCCALAGLNLTFEQVGSYSLDMSAGRGLICLAAITSGRNEPLLSCMYAIVFGFSRALQLILSNYVSPNITLVLGVIPYATIILVFLITEIPAARRNSMRIICED